MAGSSPPLQTHNSQKAEVRLGNLVQVPCVGGSTQLLEPHHCLPASTSARSWNQEAEGGAEPKLFKVEYASPAGALTTESISPSYRLTHLTASRNQMEEALKE